MSRALNHLGVPGAKELKGLSARVEELAREVHKLNAKAGGKAGGEVRRRPSSGATRSVSRVKDELADVARELESAQLNQARSKRKPAAARKAAAKKASAGKKTSRK